ncbi:hypothetical protein Tco_1228445 [Tanacetum coccineum]
MADLIFADSHNMVAYLEKLEDNADFAEIVDFLNASPIRYALIVSPTVYVSYIEQFWSTVKIKIVNNETQIRAKVNGNTIVITESYVRRDLYFNDEDGNTCLTNVEIFENLQLMGVLDLENVKDAQALEIKKLKKKVKKLEKKSLGNPKDASKQGRNEIDQDGGILWFQEDSKTHGRYYHDIGVNTGSTSINTASINIITIEPVTTASAPVTTAGLSVSTAEPSTPPSNNNSY